jgi:hypothetical protein
MKFVMLALAAVSGIAAAQGLTFESAEAEAWFKVPFEERVIQFSMESRDPDWAPLMEEAIAEEVARWGNPPVQLVSAECRESLCRIDTRWPRNVGLAETGQQLSYLYRLGLDHQGETDSSYEDNRFRWVVILRRR